jgi:hypothetical protein
MAHQLRTLMIGTAIAASGCTVEATGEVASAGMLNGMLNGFHHREGLAEYLGVTCPLLAQRLLGSGDLTEAFPAQFAAEIETPACHDFLFYTTELMAADGETLTLYAGEVPVATFGGAMNLQYLAAQVYPGYTFAHRGFAAVYEIAQIIVTQGYAALTNGIERTVSFKTKVAQLDAHRTAVEDGWPREFTQIVPFTTQAFAAMQSNPMFRARLPNFFRACDPLKTNYDYLLATCVAAADEQSIAICTEAPLPSTNDNCPVPIVVHGDTSYNPTPIPGRSCEIVEEGEPAPAGTTLVGDVAVPEGGCPLVWYHGRRRGVVVLDDRAHNVALGTNEGCDAVGPSNLVNCAFDVMIRGMPLPASYLDYYAYNIKPL